MEYRECVNHTALHCVPLIMRSPASESKIRKIGRCGSITIYENNFDCDLEKDFLIYSFDELSYKVNDGIRLISLYCSFTTKTNSLPRYFGLMPYNFLLFLVAKKAQDM